MIENKSEKPKKKKGFDRGELSMLATASSVGLSMVVAIILGTALGWWLDQYFGTKPWLFLLGLLVGIIAGFRNIFILAKRLDKKSGPPSS